MIKTFPKLFKKTNTGAIQQWSISARQTLDGTGVIEVVYGQVDGALQTATDVITTGKNLGKKNATTAYQQASNEAESKWTKQIERKGYVEDYERAKRGERDMHSVPPMLAQDFTKHAKKIVFPAALQPKLDGIRCEGMAVDGDVTLWSRTGKPITAVPHIIAQLKALVPSTGTLLFDGELYNHEYHDEFEEICSIVRDQTEIDTEQIMEYHVYDLMDDELTQQERFNELDRIFTNNNRIGHIVRVETVIVNNEDEREAYYEHCMEENYEGAIARNLAACYEPGKRSYNLQKIKEFDEVEFKIGAVFEGRGKMAGKGIFGCLIDPSQPVVFRADGSFDENHPNQFKAKKKGKLSDLVKYLKDPTLAVGKMVTVKHFGYTKYNKPRFPVAKAIRDYE